MWETERQPDKQTDWQAGRDSNTQLWRRDLQPRMVMKTVYVSCLKRLGLITLITLTFILPTKILACAILAQSVLGFVLDNPALSSYTSFPSSVSLPVPPCCISHIATLSFP